MSILPDEIISEILSPALKVSDERFSDTSDVSPFSDYSPSTSAYLLVCKDWLRVATPLLYNVVVLRSRAQANALGEVLHTNPEFGRFIKKLRIEGGYGTAMHTILKHAPNITDLFISLAIWSSDNTQGLCHGLPLINSTRVIAVDPTQSSKPLKSKPMMALLQVFFECIKTWDNLRIFGFPYRRRMERAANLTHALANSQTVHTILLPELDNFAMDFLDPFLQVPSLHALQLNKPLPRRNHERLMTAIGSHPRLKALMRHTVVDPDKAEAEHCSPVPDIAPSLNPSFIPLKSASDEIRNFVWNRILFFAMSIEDLQSSFDDVPRTFYSSRLPLLCVSKYFNRLALPHLYTSVKLTYRTAPGLSQRLKDRPDLGSFIRCISMTWIEDAIIIPILSRAPNLQKICGIGKDARIISAAAFNFLARTSGSSLREVSNRFEMYSTAMSVFTHLTELQILAIGGLVTFDSPSENMLNKLHTLRILSLSLFEPFSNLRLASLHTLEISLYHPPPYLPGFYKLLNAHKASIRHLWVDFSIDTEIVKIYDICKNLVDIEFESTYDIGNLTCETPHESLALVVVETLTGGPNAVDPAMFPALRRIEMRSQRWPTTEREISKSNVVKTAEALSKKNIILTDSTGKCWIPRVKTSRKKI